MTGLQPLGRLKQRFHPRKVLKTSTIRDFGGGLNVIDSDLNLDSRFAKVLKNIYRQPDGSNGLRPGTRLFAKINGAVTGEVVNIVYFASKIIAFTTTGQGCMISGTGVVTAIWNTAIAALLPGAPSGWSTGLNTVNFAQFKGELLVVNGVDKPLIIDNAGVVKYLKDLATSTNINTPIAKYVCAVGQWVIMAGLTTGNPQDEGTIYISNSQASGTWPGDTAPNDSTAFQVFAAASIGTSKITGLVSYRNRLLVLFQSVVVVIRLGTFTDPGGIHDPQIEDVFPQFGSVSHRSAADLGYDVLFCDVRGVPSFVQSSLSQAIDPKRASELVDPAIQQIIASIATEQQLGNIFAVYHALESLYMLFIPNGPDWASTTETRCFVYRSKRGTDQQAWAEFRDWKWRCGCRSDGGRIFFGNGDRIYILGDYRFSDEFYSDRRDDYDSNWTNGVSYTVGQFIRDTSGSVYKVLVNHTSPVAGNFTDARVLQPSYWELYEGNEISFDWEFPWADFDKRMNVKECRYIQFDTSGNAIFTCEVYVDNMRLLAIDGSDTPALSIELVSGSSGGYGDGDQPYGGGRRTVDERAWAINHKFKIMKLRVKGATRASLGLRVVSFSIGYVEGSVLR